MITITQLEAFTKALGDYRHGRKYGYISPSNARALVVASRLVRGAVTLPDDAKLRDAIELVEGLVGQLETIVNENVRETERYHFGAALDAMYLRYAAVLDPAPPAPPAEESTPAPTESADPLVEALTRDDATKAA